MVGPPHESEAFFYALFQPHGQARQIATERRTQALPMTGLDRKKPWMDPGVIWKLIEGETSNCRDGFYHSGPYRATK